MIASMCDCKYLASCHFSSNGIKDFGCNDFCKGHWYIETECLFPDKIKCGSIVVLDYNDDISRPIAIYNVDKYKFKF